MNPLSLSKSHFLCEVFVLPESWRVLSWRDGQRSHRRASWFHQSRFYAVQKRAVCFWLVETAGFTLRFPAKSHSVGQLSGLPVNTPEKRVTSQLHTSSKRIIWTNPTDICLLFNDLSDVLGRQTAVDCYAESDSTNRWRIA